MPEPITREETFLAAAAGESVTLPTPVTREEMFLAKLAGQDVTTPNPITRKEMFLEAAAQGGGGGGVTVEALTATENGTYTAPSGKAYSPVTVNVAQLTSLATGLRQFFHFDATIEKYGKPSVPKIIRITAPYCVDLRAFAYQQNATEQYSLGIEELEISLDPSKPVMLAQMLSKNSSIKKLIFTNGVLAGSGSSDIFDGNTALEEIIGAIDLSLVASNNTINIFRASALKTVTLTPSCLKGSAKFTSPYLTDASLVSIANALDGTASGMTLTLDGTVKAGLSGIMGTVTDGVFVADAGGSTTLADFITNTKGWTLA